MGPRAGSTDRVKLAWFTPYSRQSAIGHFSEIVIGELQNAADVTVFASDIPTLEEARNTDCEIELLWGKDPAAVTSRLAQFDGVIYNLGNHYEMHYRTYEVAIRRPGIVVLHDLVMHHVFAGRYLGKVRNVAGYLAELEYAHGPAGQRMGELILNGSAGPLVWDSSTMLEYHMAKSAVRGSTGVIVHSRFAHHAVSTVATVPVVHFSFPTPDTVAEQSSGTLGPRGERLKLLTIGMVNRNKLVDEMIRVIGSSDILRALVQYQVAGDSTKNVSYHDRLVASIHELHLEDVVQLLGYQDDASLGHLLHEADVVINLRNPHFGEGSWSLLETAFAAKPTVVWRHGFYDEFPDDTVAKVSSVEELKETLERLCASDHERSQRGANTLEYARRTFSTADYCRRLLAFNAVARYNQPALALADFAATCLSQLGTTAADASLVELVATEVANVSGVSTTPPSSDQQLEVEAAQH
jgi:glycosyltransferase involved in cell wall biosynthesis